MVMTRRGLHLHTFYTITLLCALTFGCANRNFNHISHDRARARQVWLAKQAWSGPCEPARVDRAYAKMAVGDGAPYAALYFMRCVKRDNWVGRIVPRRARRRF